MIVVDDENHGAEALPERRIAGVRHSRMEKADPTNLVPPLRISRAARREQRARLGEQEGPPTHHWVTLSARRSNDCGIVNPSNAWAIPGAIFANWACTTPMPIIAPNMGAAMARIAIKLMTTSMR